MSPVKVRSTGLAGTPGGIIGEKPDFSGLRCTATIWALRLLAIGLFQLFLMDIDDNYGFGLIFIILKVILVKLKDQFKNTK